MLHSYNIRGNHLHDAGDLIEDAVWIDMLSPTQTEEAQVEALLQIDIPTREDMDEIEISSRLYAEDGAIFMTAILPANADSNDPQMGPVTFVLTENRLITVRYHEPRVFRIFPPRAIKIGQSMTNAEAVLVALLEAVIDRQADIQERAARELDTLSRAIFRDSKTGEKRDYQDTLETIGRLGNLNSNLRDSTVTQGRLLSHLVAQMTQRHSHADLIERVKTLVSDANSLTQAADFLSSKITFLLDATLGMINIEQNAIIKIFSVAAVIFLPPTLISSIYGMNFVNMPELEWPLGYPYALGLMVLCAVLPYLYAKYRNWL